VGRLKHDGFTELNGVYLPQNPATVDHTMSSIFQCLYNIHATDSDIERPCLCANLEAPCLILWCIVRGCH
jgi:hypothetical protein